MLHPVASRLQHNCFNWPEDEFSQSNHAGNTTSLREGELAVEFTLKDLTGTERTLSSLLGEKPVLMVFGSYT
jgi:hypothetical protein